MIALRQAGFEPVVASMGTALTERQLQGAEPADEAALPLLRRRRGRRGGDAARDGARGERRASTSGRAAAAGHRPRRGPGGIRERLAAPVSYPVHRVRLEIERATGPRRRRSAMREAFLDALPDSPEQQEALAARDRPARPAAGDAGGARAGAGPARGGWSRRGCSRRAQRLERDALAGVLAHPELSRALSRSSARALRHGLHRRARAQPPRQAEPTASSPLLGGARRDAPRRRRSTRRRPRSCCCASGSAGCSASSRTPISSETKELPSSCSSSARLREIAWPGQSRGLRRRYTAAASDPR